MSTPLKADPGPKGREKVRRRLEDVLNSPLIKSAPSDSLVP